MTRRTAVRGAPAVVGLHHRNTCQCRHIVSANRYVQARLPTSSSPHASGLFLRRIGSPGSSTCAEGYYHETLRAPLPSKRGMRIAIGVGLAVMLATWPSGTSRCERCREDPRRVRSSPSATIGSRWMQGPGDDTRRDLRIGWGRDVRRLGRCQEPTACLAALVCLRPRRWAGARLGLGRDPGPGSIRAAGAATGGRSPGPLRPRRTIARRRAGATVDRFDT